MNQKLRAAKNEALILKKMAEVKSTTIAQLLGVHDSTISRWKNNGALTSFANMLAAVGLKVMPSEAVVFLEVKDPVVDSALVAPAAGRRRKE